jgi:GTP-binding protein YchF
MKAGLVGLPGSGKSTLFRAITKSDGSGDPFRTVSVPDRRVDALSELFQPKKRTFAKVECHDLGSIGADEKAEARLFAQMRELDALALVIRGFTTESFAYARPSVDVAQDLERLHAALQFSDFVQVEGRLEKLEKSVNKPSKTQERDKKELGVLQKLKAVLEKGGKVEDVTLHASEDELIRGFRFLTQKPVLVVLNLPEDGAGEAALRAKVPATFTRVVAIRGSLEAEISQLDAADASAFMKDYGITEPARDRLIAALYELLGLCSFLTAGEDECRAWTIEKGTSALDAAGAIHSDIQRGFIRAEVVSFDDLVAAGGLKEAKAANRMRLEGKEYTVEDGDVINFRFSV